MLTNLMWMVLITSVKTSKAKLYILKVQKDANLKNYLLETNSDRSNLFKGNNSGIGDGIENKENASAKVSGGPLCMEDNVVYIGQDISDTGKRVSSEQECHKYCEEVSECKVWVYYKERTTCQLKIFHDNLQKENNNAYASGLKDCSKGLNNLSRNEAQTHNDYQSGAIGCNGDNHGISCCPQFTLGDNTLGSEDLLEENEMKPSGCLDSCLDRHASFNGITESISETYGNGMRKCYCEFGDIQFTVSNRYQTCLIEGAIGCNGGNHDISCCPQFILGDNTLGSETLLEENEMTPSGCLDSCQQLHPTFTGITESITETYGNGMKKCYCEFGDIQFTVSDNYQTCLIGANTTVSVTTTEGPTTGSATTTKVCDDFGTPPDEGCKCNSRGDAICFKPMICISGACRTDMK